MAETKRLSFWTTGEDFTFLVRDLINSGLFYNAIEILKDGGMPDELIFTFILGGLKFEGDTRENPDLTVETDTPEDPAEMLTTGWMTMCSSEGYYYDDFDALEDSDNKHYEALKSILPNLKKNIIPYIWKRVIENEGYTIHEEVSLEEVSNGVILENGYLIECGWQEHKDLYPVLHRLGFASSSSWIHDEKVIHLSGGTLHGTIANELNNPDIYDTRATKEQIEAVFNWRQHFCEFYGGFEREKVVDAIRRTMVVSLNAGAKYGNLKFLEKYYNVKLPKIDLNPIEGRYCIRTSPDKSIAGLLNSKFEITENSENEIWADWEKYKDVIKDNKLTLFYQEYLEGDNGVAHYIKKGDFNYSVSSERGDVVRGKKTSGVISNEVYQELRDFCRQLYEDLGKQIQVEFVVKGEELYIVQLRTIDIPQGDASYNVESVEEIVTTGHSFSRGDITCDLEDVLVVDFDTDSDAILGKKALIVKQDVEFAHVLALSQSLRIPSIYGLSDDVELPNPIKIVTKYETGYIIKPK